MYIYIYICIWLQCAMGEDTRRKEVMWPTVYIDCSSQPHFRCRACTASPEWQRGNTPCEFLKVGPVVQDVLGWSALFWMRRPKRPDYVLWRPKIQHVAMALPDQPPRSRSWIQRSLRTNTSTSECEAEARLLLLPRPLLRAKPAQTLHTNKNRTVDMYIHMYICRCTRISMNLYIRSNVYICTYIHMSHTHAHFSMYIYTCMHAGRQACKHTHIEACMHANKQPDMHTCTDRKRDG